MNGSGCVFDHFGKVPPAVYAAENFSSPLEIAVYKNDIASFNNLVKVINRFCLFVCLHSPQLIGTKQCHQAEGNEYCNMILQVS